MSRPLRVLTWHVHGAYLYYLTQANCEFLLPVDSSRSPGYGGRAGDHPWGENVREIPVGELHREHVDVVICQSRDNWFRDRHEILSDEQRRAPVIYIEHDPPREHPTDTRHPVDDPDALLVHVTHFNRLMWDSGRTPTRVIEHGVKVPAGIAYSGDLERGVVVINNLASRGRRLGLDVFERASREFKLDLVGMDARSLGGLGEIPHSRLPAHLARYRYFFNPIRYTSLGLSVLEAMAVGVPVVGLATTEMVSAIENGRNGFVFTDEEEVHGAMRELLGDHALARSLGEGARQTVRERYSIERFARDWEQTVSEVAGRTDAVRVALG